MRRHWPSEIGRAIANIGEVGHCLHWQGLLRQARHCQTCFWFPPERSDGGNAEIELNVEEPVGECEEKKKKKRKLVGSLQILSEISNENFRSVVVRRKTLVQKRMERKTMSSKMMPPSVLRLKLQRF